MTHPLRFALNAYELIIEMGGGSPTGLTVSGPDEEACRRVGERFVELVQTEEGKLLLAAYKAASGEERQRSERELIVALDVPD